MLLSGLAVTAQAADPWLDDLQPLPKREWNYERAQHLLERAGFGATPQEIEQLAQLTPAQAVTKLNREGNVLHTVDFRRVYATVMEQWMGANSQSLLNGKFEPFSVFAA